MRERVLRGKYRIPFYMTTECETLLKRFMVLVPHKRTSLRNAMDEASSLSPLTCWTRNEIQPYSHPPRKTLHRIQTVVVLFFPRPRVEIYWCYLSFDAWFGSFGAELEERFPKVML